MFNKCFSLESEYCLSGFFGYLPPCQIQACGNSILFIEIPLEIQNLFPKKSSVFHSHPKKHLWRLGFQLSMFMKPYTSREIPSELYDLVKKFINKWLWSRRIIENRMKTLEICGENLLEFGQIWKLIKIWRMLSIGNGKKFFKKMLSFLIKITLEHWHFFRNFHHIFIRALPPLRQYIQNWKITSDFYNNFPDFGWGGNVPGSPRPLYFYLNCEKVEFKQP